MAHHTLGGIVRYQRQHVLLRSSRPKISRQAEPEHSPQALSVVGRLLEREPCATGLGEMIDTSDLEASNPIANPEFLSSMEQGEYERVQLCSSMLFILDPASCSISLNFVFFQPSNRVVYGRGHQQQEEPIVDIKYLGVIGISK